MDFVSYARLVKDVRHFCSKLPPVDCVLGVPRSGTMVAHLIAQNLNIPMSIPQHPLMGLCGNRVVNGDIHTLLVVDDYIITARGLKKVLENVKGAKVITASIYTGGNNKKLVDYSYRALKAPIIFEWNMFNKASLGQSCLDIDGVLCRDPKPEEYGNPEKYIQFIKNVHPLVRNLQFTIDSLVTSRYDMYRKETERWLKKHQIPYRNLYMLQSGRSRDKVIDYKSKIYKQSGNVIFIESDDKIAQGIFEKTSLPVICTDTMRLLKK